MSSLSLDNNSAAYQIRSYKTGQIQVNELTLTKSLVISAQQLISDWPPQSLAELSREHLQAALALDPEVLIIGTGEKQAFLPLELYGEFLNRGIGVEFMNTAAACRTYNALTAENRRVVAALILR